MNTTYLNVEQLMVFKDACQEYMNYISVKKLTDNLFRISIPSEDMAFECHERITDYYVTQGGFDENYEVTYIGLICEQIIDKFFDDMNI